MTFHQVDARLCWFNNFYLHRTAKVMFSSLLVCLFTCLYTALYNLYNIWCNLNIINIGSCKSAQFVPSHTMDLLWEFQWILPLYMKPISFQSKASVVCSVTAAISIDFCLKKLNVFSQHNGNKTNEYLNSAEQIPRNWNVDQLSVSITSWDIT